MPVETAAGAGLIAALSKFLSSIGITATGFGIGGALAAIVVMCVKRPRTAGEWAVALISTVVASFCGGAFVILKYQLLKGVESLDDVALLLHVLSVIGIVFSCGLPGWLSVRIMFNYMQKAEAEGKGPVEIMKDLKGVL